MLRRRPEHGPHLTNEPRQSSEREFTLDSFPRPDPESIQVLTRSTDDAKLVFDAQGGVRELPVEPGRLVLTDLIARRLARAATRIDAMFGGKAQHIEWLMIGETIYIVQSRPYLRGS